MQGACRGRKRLGDIKPERERVGYDAWLTGVAGTSNRVLHCIRGASLLGWWAVGLQHDKNFKLRSTQGLPSWIVMLNMFLVIRY